MKLVIAIMAVCAGSLLLVGCSSKKPQPVAMPVPIQQVLVCSEVRDPLEKYDLTRQIQNDVPVTYRAKICSDGQIGTVQEVNPSEVLIFRKPTQ